MRAKFIYEKFEEISDPIYDMNIGNNILKQGDKLKVKKDFSVTQNENIREKPGYINYSKDEIVTIVGFWNYNNHEWLDQIFLKHYKLDNFQKFDIRVETKTNHNVEMPDIFLTYSQFIKYFEKI
jgi:hypothetical protein